MGIFSKIHLHISYFIDNYTAMIPILISIAVGGVLASGIVLFTLKGLKTKAAAGEGADFVDDEKKSKALDEEIDRALEYLNTMLPLAGRTREGADPGQYSQ
jgi:hypothetical protein